MLTKADLEALAQVRLDDAVFLLNAGRSSSAYYLSGYAVELALKACIASSFQLNVIPDKAYVVAIYTHKLDLLLNIAGLLTQFKTDAQADTRLAAAWGITTKRSEESRYEVWDAIAAATMVNAITHPQHGVFPWVKKHW